MLTHFEKDIAQLKQENRYRELKYFETVDGVSACRNNQKLIDFSGNDYLGLSQHPALISANIEATKKWGTSTTSSRLIRGSLSLHETLEQQICLFTGAPAALTFNSGFQANAGVLPALISRHDAVFSDRLNHASLIDGLVLTHAKLKRYPHLDYQTLETWLSEVPENTTKWIISETVFSMDGDTADVQKLLTLAQKYNAWLFLDEAHAVGLFGNNRHSGLIETLNLKQWPEQLISMGTFSKALGSFGAYIAAHNVVVDILINRCRSFIYSTSLPAGIIASNIAALEVLEKTPSLPQKLWANIHQLSSDLGAKPCSAIMPIIIGDDQKTMAIAKVLLESGFYVQGIRPPTVPENTSRLRVTLSASHTEEMINSFCEQLNILGLIH